MKHIKYEALAALALLTLAGCDGATTTPEDTSVEDVVLDVPTGGYARVIPNTAFEGSSWLVVGLQPNDDTVDLTGATVRVDDWDNDDADHITIVEQACNRVRCAVVLSIEEFLDPIGQPIPRPIDAQNVSLRMDAPTGIWSLGTLSVFPLDYTSHVTTASPVRLRGTFLMSSFTMAEGTELIANSSDPTLAGRLFVTGPVTIAGTLNLAGGAGSGVAGGAASLASGSGGAPGAVGMGPGGGLAGVAGGGGGGGSHAGSGTDGTGSGGAAGEVYGDMTLSALLDDEPSCGGSGGGGGDGAAGGGGGGALLISSLHSITFTDAVIDVSGGDGSPGTGGGGGGSGGSLALGAPFISGSASLNATGGAGGTGSEDGGNGGAGRIRVDADTSDASLSIEPSFHATGPVIDRYSLELIDDDGHITVSGWAAPDSAIRVTVIPETPYGTGTPANFTTTATAEGTFSVIIDVLPGMSRVTMAQTASSITTVGQVGNTFEVAGSVVQGTVLYVASIPPAE